LANRWPCGKAVRAERRSFAHAATAARFAAARIKTLGQLSLWVALVAVFLLGSRNAEACTGTSATNLCFQHNGVSFLVDIGDGTGFVARRLLSAKPGVTLTFNVDPACNNCQFHPLYLTPSPTGAGAGPVLAGPISSGSFQYTPSATTLSQGLYYQCDVHPNMGAQIQAQVASVPAVSSWLLAGLAAGVLVVGIALSRLRRGSVGASSRAGY
jgi:hypothetical protein